MLQTERLPRSVGRAWGIAQRFHRFLLVGVIGLAVNQGLLMILAGVFQVPVPAASPMAIVASMAVTFALNEVWTWHDRGAGRVLHRAMLYGAINSGGLVINWGLLVLLHDRGMHYLYANLVGAGVAAVWNFALNNAITWRSAE